MNEYGQVLKWIITPNSDRALVVGYGTLGNTLHYVVEREGDEYLIDDRTREGFSGDRRYVKNRTEFENWCRELGIESDKF